ncbi:protein PELPK1-like [Abrus precatorius]|uniref:Protein PELPK1-like n=1 Tax=Abrus precatorius TaxID=3816 RepID=A0A8B8K6C9_ABRPR|nr:protein PELPK1-like [Abrus precatorius]
MGSSNFSFILPLVLLTFASMMSDTRVAGARNLLQSTLPLPKVPNVDLPPISGLPPLPKPQLPSVPDLSMPLPLLPPLPKPELPPLPNIPIPGASELPKLPKVAIPDVVINP